MLIKDLVQNAQVCWSPNYSYEGETKRKNNSLGTNKIL